MRGDAAYQRGEVDLRAGMVDGGNETGDWEDIVAVVEQLMPKANPMCVFLDLELDQRIQI